MIKYRSRRQGLTTERLSQNSRDGLERVQQKTALKNTILRIGIIKIRITLTIAGAVTN